jgi:hypothetical protein
MSLWAEEQEVMVSIGTKHPICSTNILVTQCSVTNFLPFKVSSGFIFVLRMPQADPWAVNVVRDAVTLSGPVIFIDETTGSSLLSGWITALDTPLLSNYQETAPVSSVLQISIPVLATPGEPVQTPITPIIAPTPTSSAAPQLRTKPVRSDPINPCNINTAPLGLCTFT